MNQIQSSGTTYLCPMHSDVRQSSPGKCTKCGMDLVPEGAKFAMLRHIAKNPAMLIGMVVLMIIVMAAIMMMR